VSHRADRISSGALEVRVGYILRVMRSRPVLAHLRAIFAIAVAMIVAVGVVRAGARYFECVAMGTMSAPCCAHEGEQDEAPAVEDLDACCAAKKLAQAPRAATVPSIDVPPAAVVAIVSVPAAFEAPRQVVSPRRTWLARDGPPPRYASDERARLQVFLS
jgi:hypothetical protein